MSQIDERPSQHNIRRYFVLNMVIELIGRAEEVVVQPPLSQAVGYVVVVVIGLVIAFGKCLKFLVEHD
jgi:hypothetical protein